jgi:hypothetical protein
MKYTHEGVTFRDIAKEIKKSVHWIQSQRTILSKQGFLRNARPKKALGWKVTPKGIQLLVEEGILKERSNGDS